MRAVVYEDTRRVGVHDVEDAALEEPTDVVVRLSSSAICGTDLHMYDGRTGAEPGLVFGHEPLFAAKYLARYATAEKATILDALIRRPFWFNVSRFFAGFANPNEIGGLVDGLSEEI